VDNTRTLLVNNTSYILILGGIVAASWLLEKLARPAPVVGKPVSWLVKLTSLFGFFVGILLLITAAATWSAKAWDSGTRYLLIVTGLALFLKPLKDIPWAALIGLVVGGLCAGSVYFFYPLPEMVNGVSSTWIYLAIFFIPALLVYMLLKFVEDVVRLIGTILASKSVSIVLGLICIVQGILLQFFGHQSLFDILARILLH
jgi:hypothetical protein